MLSMVPRTGLFRHFFALTFLLLLVGLFLSFPSSTAAAGFTARALGDFNQVAVIEVSGNFDALDLYGQPNGEPRRALAREFYRSHGDAYDFLVIFTNLDVRMPAPQAKAFFSPSRNDVQGIGLPLYNDNAFYAPDGVPLQHLEGTIDMGNLVTHVLEPTDPRFETTLRVLTHEMLHRWGAYVHFLDNGTVSDALLGIDRSHWSFLLDSADSTLYGNRWRDNGDGTYTALTPESAHSGELFGRLLSPLDLYLMGFVGPGQVPPLQLIDAPGLDPAQLPAPGVIIPGTARTITIDDIIAAEGPRLPPAAQTRKYLRMAFILATAPGSFSADDPAGNAALAAIGRLRGEWERRFAILTDGVGTMQTGLRQNAAVADNPPPVADTESLAGADALIDAGVSWLLAQQQADGRWQEQSGTVLRDTAEAIRALHPFPQCAAAVSAGQAWLRQATAENQDFLARCLATGLVDGAALLLAAQNNDGGWGSGEDFCSNPFDTALAIQALSTAEGSRLADASAYLHATQQPDGGWNAGSGPSQLAPTCLALLALNNQRGTLLLENPVAAAKSWLAEARNHDGGFGHPTSNVIDTALALLALKASGGAPEMVSTAADWLLARQASSGSWQGRPFATALAVQALHAAQVAPDLTVTAADISFAPPLLTTIPGEVAITVQVRNLGREAVSAVPVAIYAGDPATGGTLVESLHVSVNGNSSASLTVVVPITAAGVHSLVVAIDEEGEVAESDEWNNRAVKFLTASLPPPTVGFASAASAVAESTRQHLVPVTLSHPWHEPVTVSYAPDATSNAVSGSGYLPLTGTLIFAPGETVAEIGVELLDDQVAESDKQLVVSLLSTLPGALGNAQHAVTILDDEAPAIGIVSPSPGILADASPQLLFTTTAATARVYVDGQLSDRRSGDRLGPLADGDHSLEVAATNSLGISSSLRVNFRIDTTLPVITILSPVAGMLSETMPLLDYNVAGAVGYRIELDGVLLSKVSAERLDPLVDGPHTLTITAWNTAGAEISANVNFTVDTASPQIAIIYPNDDVLRETTPLLFCTGEESALLTVKVDGLEVATNCGERLGPLVDGAHQVQVTAIDSAGNQTVANAEFVVFTGMETSYPETAGWPRNATKFYGGMAVDRHGNVYLAAYDDYVNMTLQKYTVQGELLWQRKPSIEVHSPRDLAVDAAGNLFVVGTYNNGDGFVKKFASADGAYLAGYNFASGGSDYPSAVQVDGDGQVIVAGDTGGALFAAPNGSMNVWIARFDNDCHLLAGRQLTRNGTQRVSGRGSLALDRVGNAYLAGSTDAPTFGSSNGGEDAFVIKFDRSLQLMAPSLQFGTTGDDQALDVTVDVYGTIYVSGGSREEYPFRETGFIYKFAADGNYGQQVVTGIESVRSLVCERDGTLFAIDEFGDLRKFDSNLQLLWSRTLAWTYRYQLARDPFGDLYAAGDGGTSGFYASVIKLTDHRRPAVALDHQQYCTNRSQIELGGTMSPGATVHLVDDILQQSTPTTYPQPGCWQMTMAKLPVGVTEVLVKAVATTGFNRRARATVTVDVTPPQVTINAPVDGRIYTDKPTLDYSVSDGRIEILVNGVALYKASGHLLEALRPGWNVIRVEATDPAGNVGFATVRILAEAAAVGELPLGLHSLLQVGTYAEDTVVAVAAAPNGDIYLLGHTTGNFAGFINAGGRDPFIARFDAFGRHLATWQFGQLGDESGGALAIDAAGNLYVTWNVQSVSNKGQIDPAVRLAKFSATGTRLWQTELNSSANDVVYALTLDSVGNVLLAGETYGSLDRQRYGGAGDYFLAKYNAAGSKQWVRLSGEAAADGLRAVVVDATGLISGAGYAANSLGGVPVPGHVVILRFDSGGGLLKVEPVPLPGGDFAVKALHCGPGGRLLTAGSNGARYFLAAYDAVLQRQWLELSAETEVVNLTGMVVDGSGNLLVSAATGAVFAGNRAFGGSDGVVIKHAATGTRLWSVQYGSSGDDFIGGMALGSGGELWLGGHTDGLLGTDRAGMNDLYLAELTIPDLPTGPALTIDPYPQLINTTSLMLSGRTTPGASLSLTASFPVYVSPVTLESDGRWSVSIADLPANIENQLTVTAADELGTIGIDIVVTVDTLPPVLTVNPSLSPTMLAMQMLSGTVEAGSRLEVQPSHSTPVEIATDDGLWSYSLHDLQPGDNLATFTATDSAGNRTTVSVVIVYVPPPPPTLSVTPAIFAADTAGNVVLDIGQIRPSGGKVDILQMLDLDGDGHMGNGEPVIRHFAVVDGHRSDSAGLLGDTDGNPDGKVAVQLNMHFVNDRFHAPGDYLFVAITDAGSTTAGFTVLPCSRSQRIEGTVRDGQGRAIGGTLVKLTDRWGYSHRFAISDLSGYYRLEVDQPGEYLLRPMSADYAYVTDAPQGVALAVGQTVTYDLSMADGSYTLSGRVRVSATLAGVSGVMVSARSDRHLAESMTDAAGNYSLLLPAGTYHLAVAGDSMGGLAGPGYLAGPTSVRTVNLSADSFDNDLSVTPAAARLCGEVRTLVGALAGGVPVQGVNSSMGWLSQGISDGAGNYCVAVDGNNGWMIGLPEHLTFAAGWVGNQVTTDSAANVAVYRLDAWADVGVADAAGRALAGIPVVANHPGGAIVTGVTAADGSCRLGLSSEPAGEWQIVADGQAAGYLPVAPAVVSVAPGIGIHRNFVLQKPALDNTIIITRASYDARKKLLTVEATSGHPQAQLQVDGYGAMTFVRLFKGKYYWSLTKSVPVKPATVTVSGAEGSRTVTVQ